MTAAPTTEPLAQIEAWKQEIAGLHPQVREATTHCLREHGLLLLTRQGTGGADLTSDDEQYVAAVQSMREGDQRRAARVAEQAGLPEDSWSVVYPDLMGLVFLQLTRCVDGFAPPKAITTAFDSAGFYNMHHRLFALQDPAKILRIVSQQVEHGQAGNAKRLRAQGRYFPWPKGEVEWNDPRELRRLLRMDVASYMAHGGDGAFLLDYVRIETLENVIGNRAAQIVALRSEHGIPSPSG